MLQSPRDRAYLIDLFGDVSASEHTAVPETDSDAMPARGFRIFYHPENAVQHYVKQIGSTPCTLKVSDVTETRMTLDFNCANLVHFDDAARKVIVRGSVRCARRYSKRRQPPAAATAVRTPTEMHQRAISTASSFIPTSHDRL